MKIFKIRKAILIILTCCFAASFLNGCGGEKQPKWDTEHLEVSQNDNLDKAGFFIANSNWKKNVENHKTPKPIDLANDIVQHFGDMLGIEGEVVSSEEIPKTEELLDVWEGKEIEGTDIWMVYVNAPDGTPIQYMDLSKADHIKTGMKIKFYGYAVGYAPSSYMGDIKMPVIVGKQIDILN